MQQRMAAGWQLVSIEWRRELPGDEGPSEGAFTKKSPTAYASLTIASGWSTILGSAGCSPR